MFGDDYWFEFEVLHLCAPHSPFERLISDDDLVVAVMPLDNITSALQTEACSYVNRQSICTQGFG